MEAGGLFKQELGAGNFLKTTANYSTGLLNDTYALSATVVRKTGDGVIDKQWTDAWAYYIGASYAVNEFERLFTRYTVQMCIRAEKQPIIAYRRAGVEYAAIAGKGVLSKLFEIGFGFQHKRPGITTD